MKLRKLRISNFRCFDEIDLEIASMHALVGVNNAGKSTILKAIDFMLNPSSKKINEECFCRGRTTLSIEVEGLFDGLSSEEQALLASYLRPDGMFQFKRSAEMISQDSSGDRQPSDDEESIRIVSYYCRPQPRIEWLKVTNCSAAAIEEWWKVKDSLVYGDESFAKFVGDKKPGVQDWKKKAAEFASHHLQSADYEDDWVPNPQGYANVLKATLPHCILIPAVRDASDESKVTKSNPFGKLIYEIVRNLDSPFRENLAAKLKETTRLLNREGLSERAAGVAEVEDTIKKYLSEMMDADLELEFRPPTVEVLLTTPRIVINDGFRGGVDGKGHGLQRAVIFAILRAYATLVTDRSRPNRRPLILAVEEPELYMHPTAQRTIRKVMRSIANGGDQVLFSAHSPLLVDVAFFDEIVRFESARPSANTGVHSERRFQLALRDLISDLERRWPRLKGRVSDASIRERYSHAYSPGRNEGFFAKKVILVEGPTETYSLPIYAAAMGQDLDLLSISVIECGSKDQIDRLYRVFNELGLSCFVVFDFDRDNKDSDRIRESRDLLKLLGASDIERPKENATAHNCFFFATTWEDELAKEIPDYSTLVEQARRELGLNTEAKPLVARYIARKLTTQSPIFIPRSIKAILDNAISVQRTGSCLTT